MTRDFIIQRYAVGMWPYVLGRRPFIVAGPNFKRWIVPKSIERTGSHHVKDVVLKSISKVCPSGTPSDEASTSVAELMLRDGIVQAIWSTRQGCCADPAERWERALDETASNIKGSDVAEAVREFLSGLGTAQMAASYVSEDGISLEAMALPEPGPEKVVPDGE